MSLYDKDNPQHLDYAARWRMWNENYTKRTDPLGYYWRRGLRHLAETSGVKIPLDLSPRDD